MMSRPLQALGLLGLFGLAAKDSPRDRMPTIGWLANRYDVILLQEDFEYPDVIRDQMQRHEGYRGNGLGWHPVLWTAKLLLLPANLLCGRFSLPYGSGLTTFVPRGSTVPDSVVRKPYRDCAGWFGTKSDCWARKGYLRVRMRAPNGAEAVLHDRAGGSGDNIARTYTAAHTPSLAALAGQAIAGTWKLLVSDHEAIDVGKLNKWTLTLRRAQAAINLAIGR